MRRLWASQIIFSLVQVFAGVTAVALENWLQRRRWRQRRRWKRRRRWWWMDRMRVFLWLLSGSFRVTCRLKWSYLSKPRSCWISCSQGTTWLIQNWQQKSCGLMLIPRSNDDCSLIWDVTQTHTVADAQLDAISCSAGGAAELEASIGKYLRTTPLLPKYFVPLAFETKGSINSAELAFITGFGYILRYISG